MLVLITGTDTGVGKTVAHQQILRHASRAGVSVHGLKPIETGVERITEETTDTSKILLTLQSIGRTALSHSDINLYSYRSPVAPQVAAEYEELPIDWGRLIDFIRSADSPDKLITVEGAGGLLVPIWKELTFADLARELQMSILVVVGSKLGCINHTLLTVECIRQRELPLLGYIFNELGPEEPLPAPDVTVSRRHNRQQLKQSLFKFGVSEVGYIPYLEKASDEDRTLVKPLWSSLLSD